jgi:penicillin-binding protein 1A
VTTTLSWATQQLAEKAISDAAVFKGKPTVTPSPLNAAMVVLDAASGEIRALVGGRDHVASQFDRATQARRQPGSAFKPIVYAAALFAGMSANEIVEDEPVVYEDHTLEQFWEPRNYGDEYHGSTTLAEALARSYNAVAVKLLEKVGIDETVALARRMGIASPLHHGLSLALGSDETTLLELSSAYSVFPNGGLLAEPHAVLMVRDAQGNLLHAERPKTHDAMDARTAYIMTRMLRGVVERGTGTAARVQGQVVAGKTGTTNSYADAWFIGFTPDVVAGCWVGNDDRSSLGRGRAGGQTAAPIVGAFLKTYLQERPKRDFVVPDGIRDADVCAVTGLLATADCEDLWNLAFEKAQVPSEYCEFHGPMGMADVEGEEGMPAEGAEAEELPGMMPVGLSELARRMTRSRPAIDFELPADAWKPPQRGAVFLDLPPVARRDEAAPAEEADYPPEADPLTGVAPELAPEE